MAIIYHPVATPYPDGEEMFTVRITFADELGNVVMLGQQDYAETVVGKTTAEEAIAHVETYFLPDLRAHFKSLRDMVLPGDTPPAEEVSGSDPVSP